jgi:hypothetical protein
LDDLVHLFDQIADHGLAAIDCDAHDDLHGDAQLEWIHERMMSGDDSGVFKLLDPFGHRRSGETYPSS